MDIIEVFKGEWEGIKALIFSLAAIILLNTLDSHIGLKASIGDNPALILYGILSILFYIMVATIWACVDSRRVILRPAPSLLLERMPPPLRGYRYIVALEVAIPKGWEITDCYATIEHELMIYYEDRVLLEPKFTEWFADKTKPDYKVLRWQTPLDQGYKITIGENSNTESSLVGMISDGSIPDGHGEYVPIRTFDYCLFSNVPTSVKFGRLGLRTISLSFHWKRNGRRWAKKFDGYLLADASDGPPKLLMGAGHYTKNPRIPKPALRATDLRETDEEGN